MSRLFRTRLIGLFLSFTVLWSQYDLVLRLWCKTFGKNFNKDIGNIGIEYANNDDLIAKNNGYYSRYFSFLGINYFSNMIKSIIKFIPIKDGNTVFDAGCGNGQILKEIKKNVDITASGCDISDNIDKISKNVKGTFYKKNILEMSSHKKKYDIVYSFGVIQHILVKDLEMFINILYKLTKINGRLYIGNIPDYDNKDFCIEKGIENFHKKEHIEWICKKNDYKFKILQDYDIWGSIFPIVSTEGHCRFRFSVIIYK